MSSSPAEPARTANRAPASWRAYVPLAKPGITALICTVGVGGFVLADPRSIDIVRLALLVATGAAASAGASVLNHYLDRDVDRRMRRTRERLLAADPGAPSLLILTVGIGLLALGVGAAAVLLNLLTGFSIFLGGLAYVVVYTLWLKRRSSWNIVIGGFAGSAPALAGSAAAVGHWTGGAMAFALLVFLWTPPHFWSLALLLREDYARADLPMLPRMDDVGYSGKVVVVSAALLMPAAFLIGWSGAVVWPVLVALVALGAIFTVLALPLWTNASRQIARRGFIFSGPYLLAVVAAILANAALVRVGVPAGL
jgi:protoheme IX farnesyltransferase